MKRIILLSDGTGNSSAKLFKTNVWRLYQSLDLDPAGTGVRQIACYNDGVGTSAFKPLALLGGMFGYGLKRNVLHLYEFLCQNWEPGDEISIFGFSRGAFTARIVAGLIAREGILLGQDSRTLAHAIRDVYRRYRFNKEVIISMPGVGRLIRHGFLHIWRRLTGQTGYAGLDVTVSPDEVANDVRRRRPGRAERRSGAFLPGASVTRDVQRGARIEPGAEALRERLAAERRRPRRASRCGRGTTAGRRSPTASGSLTCANATRPAKSWL